MPLVACDETGVRLLAPLLADEEWESLGQQQLTACCCDSVVHRRTSTRGVRHFVHRSRSDCSTAPESWQHVLLKSQVAAVLSDVPGEVDIEVELGGVRADVLYRSPTANPLAIEIQWSRQTLDEHERRTREYATRGIDAVWIYRSSHFRRWTPKLPPASVLVDISDTRGIVITDHGTDCSSDLESFLGLIAEGARWDPGGNPPAGPTVDLVVEIHGGYACWKCGSTASAFEIAGARLCCLDYPVGHPRMWSQCDLLHRAQERGSIPGPPDAYRIEYRLTKTTGNNYWAHVCPGCEAVQGDWYMLDDLLDRRSELEDKPELVPLTCRLETALQALDDLQTPPHWCRARRDNASSVGQLSIKASAVHASG